MAGRVGLGEGASLEHSLLEVPHEALVTCIRNEQRLIERDLTSSCGTLNKLAKRAKTDKKLTTKRTADHIDGVIKQLEGLKRKVC
tara:strand:- start:587 stop:841 length:255 start_codon:yes stop_codon:yes gene_type:complete